ncbi:ABC transporter ATP-binding protein / permease protein [[Mycoplasma] cavipharyngis]|uniref:ATP-binding cassette domain-containing protein n=1 Tax=[Mycoplasma] cavipharyngis TaxID=92757 RepID=UPI00370457B9
MKNIFKYFKKYPFLTIITFLVCLIMVVEEIVVFYLTSLLIRIATTTSSSDLSQLFLILWIDIGVFVFGIFSFYIAKFSKNKLLTQINADLMFDLIDETTNQNIREFNTKQKSFYLANIRNVDEIAFGETIDVVFDLFTKFFGILGGTILIFILNPIIATIIIGLILILNLLPFLIFSKISSSKYQKNYLILQQSSENISHFFQKYQFFYFLGKNLFFFSKLISTTEKYNKKWLRGYRLLVFVELIQAMTQFLTFIIFAIVLELLLINYHDLVSISVSIFLVVNISIIINSNIRGLIVRLYSFIAHLKYFDFIKNLKPTTADNYLTKNLNIKKITLKNLSFKYDDQNEIFTNFNFVFEAGKKYAIVGPSGVGKSTLINLITKQINNYQGQILINDQELKSINQKTYYDNFTYLEAKEFVFQDSIYNNVSLWTDNKEQEVKNALKRAQFSNEYYFTNLNNKAIINDLSTGEKQRINFARHFFRNKNVLILDEALANLDKENVQGIIKEIFADQNLLLINVTHHLGSEAALYDQVIRINGKEN